MVENIRGPERRIVLVGKSGSGISATGNTILGREFFERGISWKPITQTCQKEEALLKGRMVVVVDTPDFSNIFPGVYGYRPAKDIAAEVRKCVKFCSPGPHIILHVICSFRNFWEEPDMAEKIEEIFGLKAKDYTIVLFAYENDLGGESLKNFISSRDKKLKEYIAECGNRYLVFNNMAKEEEREAQVAELMTMIDDLVEMNRDAPCYTEDMMNFN